MLISSSCYLLVKGLSHSRTYTLSKSQLNRVIKMVCWFTQRHLNRNSRGLLNTSSRFLRRTFGQAYYRQCLDILIDLKILISNPTYKRDHFPKSYRIASQFLDDEFIELDIVLSKPAPVDFALNRFLSDLSFSDEARPYFEGRLKRLRKPFKRHVWRESFNAIERGNFWISRDNKTGRIFSNVSSITKWLRPYLLLRGSETTEFDIKNSQPFFAAALYPEESAEKSRYLELVCAGKFYEAINDGLKRPYPLPKRDQLKRKTYREIFFGKVDDRYEAWTVFKDLFPILAAAIINLKKDSHNKLALRLQEVEASCIVENLLAECLAADLPVVTVHDSIICRKTDGDVVQEMMKGAILKVMNVLPKIDEKAA